MARNSEGGNPRLLRSVQIGKILVVGDRRCGKTTFIERFATRVRNEILEDDEFARIFDRMLGNEMGSNYVEYVSDFELNAPYFVKIVEISSAPEIVLGPLIRRNSDANGIIFMYAIDDPSGFVAMPVKWIQTLEEIGCKTDQPSFLVGNKQDLRRDQRVIENLALHNQVPVTRQEGESLKNAGGLQYFLEISSTAERDFYLELTFHFIMEKVFQHYRGKINN